MACDANGAVKYDVEIMFGIYAFDGSFLQGSRSIFSPSTCPLSVVPVPVVTSIFISNDTKQLTILGGEVCDITELHL